MTREEIDRLWQRALIASVRDGEQFTRYHFAALVLEEAAKEVMDMDCAHRCGVGGELSAALLAKARALKGAKE